MKLMESRRSKKQRTLRIARKAAKKGARKSEMAAAKVRAVKKGANAGAKLRAVKKGAVVAVGVGPVHRRPWIAKVLTAGGLLALGAKLIGHKRASGDAPTDEAPPAQSYRATPTPSSSQQTATEEPAASGRPNGSGPGVEGQPTQR